MSFYDDDKQNFDHYYSPTDERNDDDDIAEVPYTSHYYSPSDGDRDEEDVLPFSHVDFDDEDEESTAFDEEEDNGEFSSENEENADNGVIDGYFDNEDEECEPSSLEENAFDDDADNDYSQEFEPSDPSDDEDIFSEEDVNEAFDSSNESRYFEDYRDEAEEKDEEEETCDFEEAEDAESFEEKDEDEDLIQTEKSYENGEEFDELDEFTEPVDPTPKKVEFIAEDDGYDYSQTDDADDMADDDNVFDKEPEYLFNDEYPEEPEKLGAITRDETESDYMDPQISFDDFTGYSEEPSHLTENFFSTPPRAEEEPKIAEQETAEAPEEAKEEPVVEAAVEEPNEPIVEAAIDEQTPEEAVVEEPTPETFVERAAEPEVKFEAEKAFERERESYFKTEPTVKYDGPADRTPEKTPIEGNNNSEQKKKQEKRYMFMEDSSLNVAKIMVCGVGGAGNNAVNRMIDMNVSTAAFVAINTDKQALMLSKCAMENRYQIGASETKGLGAGADPDVGERAAEESRQLIEEIVDGIDLLFIAAGMGGGTGTGAAPVIAKIAREKGCVTVAVVTKPFGFEGRKRAANAEKGIANLKKYVDTIIIIPNDKLMEALRPDTPIVDALGYADDTLRQGICGIADLIATPSLINLDFADVRTVIKDQGLAHMGIGRAKGDNRIMEAVREAVSSPLLETTIEGARGIILNVTGGNDLTIRQVNDAARQVQDIIDPSANIIFGMNINPKLQEEVIITLIATGFNTDVGAIDEQEEEDDAQARAYQRLFSKNPEAANEPVEEVSEPEPEKVVEPEPEPEVEDKNKGGGIPSFMRRLFKK